MARRLRRRQLKKAIHKVWFHDGPLKEVYKSFRGRRRPARPTRRERNDPVVQAVVTEMASIHREAFREACIEVTGEDPEVDWA